MLNERENIGKDLAGMLFIGQAIDYRYARIGSEALDDVLAEGTNHDDVAHAGHDLRGIFNGFAAAELAVARVEIDGGTAELMHAGLKGEACAGRIFFEHHHQRAVQQRMVGFVILEFMLDDFRALDQVRILVE